MHKLNRTDEYHRYELTSLGWELTVCNTLENPLSPARQILLNKNTYGEQLFSFLSRHIDWQEISRILEIGGGYGFLMRGLLKKLLTEQDGHSLKRQITMLDISPLLLNKQREALTDFPAQYIETDFLSYEFKKNEVPDLIIFNENLGDFPTLVCVDTKSMQNCENVHEDIIQMRRLFDTYHLPLPAREFNFNLGALLALEKACDTGAAYIFISEHSCEAQLPEEYWHYTKITATGSPSRIALYGHDEYTIQFSHLCSLAVAHGYKIKRGAMADILPFHFDEALQALLLRVPQSDADEIIHHFFSDLFQYEYLLLHKK